jgi:hypothetical protein
MVCGLLVAGSVHAAKSLVARPLVEVSTAGLGVPVVSTLEDVIATIVSILAVALPILMVIVVFLMIWLTASYIKRFRRPRSNGFESEG